jgi:hypothetical protein
VQSYSELKDAKYSMKGRFEVVINRALFVVVLVVLALSVALPACAPATPATPATPAAPPADQKYTNAEYGFSITYPGTWKTTTSALASTVFFAQGPGGAFDDFVQVNVRPGNDVKEAAMTWATEQVAAKKLDAKPVVTAEKDVTLGNGIAGKQITIEVDVIIMKLGSVYLGFVKDGKVVMINAAGLVKPNIDKYAVWQKLLDTVTFTAPPAAK